VGRLKTSIDPSVRNHNIHTMGYNSNPEQVMDWNNVMKDIGIEL